MHALTERLGEVGNVSQGRQIEPHHLGPSTGQLANFLRDPVALLEVFHGQHDAPAPLGQFQGGLAADPARGTGYHHVLAVDALGTRASRAGHVRS